MAYFLVFIVSFGTGFVVDNVNKFSGGLFMGIFFSFLFPLFKRFNMEIPKIFDGWEFINGFKFWLGFVSISSLGFFSERVIFSLLLQ